MLAISCIILILSLSIVTRVSVSVSFNQSSEYALRDYHHELKSVEIEEELKDDDDDVAQSEEINRAEDKMLANNKFVVKFKHKNLNNDKVTLHETITPMNNYKSIYTSHSNRNTHESSEETNEINTLDKNDIKKIKFVKDLLKEDKDYDDKHPKDTAGLVMVTKKLRKKVAKKPGLRNQDNIQHKNLKLYQYLIKTLFPKKTLKIKPQSYGDIIYKRVPHKKTGQESKKNPIKSEIMEDMTRQKLKEYYKNKLKAKKMAKKTPSDIVDTISVETDMFKYDKVEKNKPQKHRKNKQNNKNILKNKIKKEISRTKHGNQKRVQAALRNDDILSYNDNPYERVTKYINYDRTTHKVKKIHTSPNVSSYKLKHEGEREFDSGKLRLKKWESSEEIEPYDLARLNNEKKYLNSSEELSREDAGENSPRLPFYLSSTLATKRLTFKKRHTKKYKGDLTSTFVHLDEVKRTPRLRYNEDAGVKQKNVYKNHNIDINAKLDKWSSSKMIDLLTEKVAAKMLKKLDESLYAKGLRTLEKAGHDNETIEQIEILFNNYGEMEIRRKGEDNINGRTIYFDTHNARRRI